MLTFFFVYLIISLAFWYFLGCSYICLLHVWYSCEELI